MIYGILKKFFSALVMITVFSIFIACSGSGTSVPTGQEEQPVNATTDVDDSLDRVEDGMDSQVDSVNGDESSLSNSLETMASELGIVYFDFDQFDIRTNMEEVVEQNSAMLNSDRFSVANIRLEGNSDEWGSDEYNYALSLKRAKAVKSFLIDEGVDEERISLLGNGEGNPVCEQSTKNCWQKNRRVETKLLP